MKNAACIRIDIRTGVLTEKNKMGVVRSGFGTCFIGHFIYIVGGSQNGLALNTVEKYNIFTDKWQDLRPRLPDEFSIMITVVTVKKRLIYGFGGFSETRNLQNSHHERILRLDTQRPTKPWQSIIVANPCTENAFNYGVIPLGFGDFGTVC